MNYKWWSPAWTVLNWFATKSVMLHDGQMNAGWRNGAAEMLTKCPSWAHGAKMPWLRKAGRLGGGTISQSLCTVLRDLVPCPAIALLFLGPWWLSILFSDVSFSVFSHTSSALWRTVVSCPEEWSARSIKPLSTRIYDSVKHCLSSIPTMSWFQVWALQPLLRPQISPCRDSSALELHTTAAVGFCWIIALGTHPGHHFVDLLMTSFVWWVWASSQCLIALRLSV